MERSEPSLVPEWLKGAGGGGGAIHHSQPPIHQDEGGGSFPSRQRSQAHGAAAGVNHGDYDSPRYSAASDRTYYSSSRRGGSNTTGASDRPGFDRDPYSRAYSSFGRSSGYRGVYDGIDRDRDGSRDRERDWDWERERDREFRERERDRALGFGGGDDRDRDRDRPDGSNFRRPIGAPGRYDPDVPLRRTQSMGSGRALENGEKKTPVDLGTLPTAPPTNSGTLTSSMQKAAFERNFPSLGAQEKQGAVQSNIGNVSVLSPRPSWQSSSPRTERPSSSAPGLTPGLTGPGAVPSSVNVGGSGIGGEGWSSALAEVPVSLTGTSSINGVTTGGASVPTLTGVGSGLTTGGAPALIVPKMAEALSQNPPRVRTPPQYSTESQRLEADMKQSRQLIPMKPSLPKNMGPREKIKPKVVRAVDVITPQPIKLSQPLSSSQLVSSPFRPPAPPRQEPLKVPPGKLNLVRKTSKEAVSAALLPGSALKMDSLAASSSLVSSGGAVTGLGGVVTGSSATPNLVPVPVRKQKQLLDRRAVPIPPISVVAGSEGGSGPRSKEGGSSEDKRPTVPAQNRSDFFNALRKKAAGVGTGGGNSEKIESGSQLKNDGVNGKGMELEDEVGPYSGEGIENPVYKMKENGMAATSKSTISDLDTYGIAEEKERIPFNGVIGEGAEGNSEQSTASSSPVAPAKRATATEEEEAAFLRSLGWEESAEESGEGLTEEEINSFYQERLRSMSISPSLPVARNHRLRDFQVEIHVGSIGSISSGISTSDSESDDDLHVRRR